MIGGILRSGYETVCNFLGDESFPPRTKHKTIGVYLGYGNLSQQRFRIDKGAFEKLSAEAIKRGCYPFERGPKILELPPSMFERTCSMRDATLVDGNERLTQFCINDSGSRVHPAGLVVGSATKVPYQVIGSTHISGERFTEFAIIHTHPIDKTPFPFCTNQDFQLLRERSTEYLSVGDFTAFLTTPIVCAGVIAAKKNIFALKTQATQDCLKKFDLISTLQRLDESARRNIGLLENSGHLFTCMVAQAYQLELYTSVLGSQYHIGRVNRALGRLGSPFAVIAPT